jgi:hypothetical protein
MEPEVKPNIQLKTSEPEPSSPFKSKGIIIAVIIVIVAAVIGFSALIGLGSTSQYQGYIKQIEDQTADLQDEAPAEEGVAR